GIVAFEQTFYAFARDNCVSCHGGTIAPYFAVDDVNMAYAAAKDSQYVNFQSPSGSKLAVYSGNGHCGVIGCANNSSVAAQRIQSWAAVELAAVENPGGGGGDPTTPTLPGTGGPATGGVNPGARVTTTLALPNLPTSGTYVPLRWELSQLNPSTPLVGNALFEIEAQRLSDTTYRVRNPRIVGLTAPIRLTNIHIYVKP